jgi:hypothetical protein
MVGGYKGRVQAEPAPYVAPPGWMIAKNLLSQWCIQPMVLQLDYGSAVSQVRICRWFQIFFRKQILSMSRTKMR